VGTSVMRWPASVALTTISLANSMPVRQQVEPLTRRGEAAQAAVEVAHRRAEEQPPEPGQHRVAQVAVQRRHRAGAMPPKAVAHHQVVALTQLLDERVERREVVAVVGVAHDHEGPRAAGCRPQRAP
jgi:hypothetical protein